MATMRIDRKASDNKYLHRDFHIGGDKGLVYVGEKYGDNGVKEYLRIASARVYSPLVKAVKDRGLSAIADYLKNLYETEEASDALDLTLSGGKLDVRVLYSPAVRYMRSAGYTPSRWYIEQTRTVFETLSDLAGIGFTMRFYNEQTGEAEYSFFTV